MKPQPPEPFPSLFPSRAVEGQMRSIIWSPDGDYMACTIHHSRQNVTWIVVQVWDSFTGERISGCGTPCSFLKWSPDSTKFIITSGPAMLTVWDALASTRLGSNSSHKIPSITLV